MLLPRTIPCLLAILGLGVLTGAGCSRRHGPEVGRPTADQVKRKPSTALAPPHNRVLQPLLHWQSYCDRSIQSLAFSPNGSLLASGYGETALSVWDTQASRQKWLREVVDAEAGGPVAWSPDAAVVAYAEQSGSDSCEVFLYDVSTAQLLRSLRGHDFQINSVAVSPDGRTLASASSGYKESADELGHILYYEEIRLWSPQTGRQKRLIRWPVPGGWSGPPGALPARWKDTAVPQLGRHHQARRYTDGRNQEHNENKRVWGELVDGGPIV
jgi:WD40 repeat protein